MASKRNDEPKRLVSLVEILIFTLCVVALITLTYAFFVGFNKGIPSDRILGGLEKRDWLYFWGSIIGVIGTTLFAWISWKQNRTLAHINTEQEKQRREFSELELAATFYSSIFIERVTITDNLLQIFMQSTGRVPPSTVNIDTLQVFRGRKNTSDVIDAVLLHEEHNSTYRILCQQSKSTNNSYLIQIRDGHFLSHDDIPTAESESYDFYTEPSLRLYVKMVLLNPLKVQTTLEGEISFEFNIEMTKANVLRSFVFVTFDSFLETQEYIYSELA